MFMRLEARFCFCLISSLLTFVWSIYISESSCRLFVLLPPQKASRLFGDSGLTALLCSGSLFCFTVRASRLSFWAGVIISEALCGLGTVLERLDSVFPFRNDLSSLFSSYVGRLTTAAFERFPGAAAGVPYFCSFSKLPCLVSILAVPDGKLTTRSGS
jgi:hypothetical protein